MEIKIIRNTNSANRMIPKGQNILEMSGVQDSNGAVTARSLSLYDPAQNTVVSVMKEQMSLIDIPIYDCIWDSVDVYYATATEADENSLSINLFRYSADQKSTSCILRFKESKLILNGYIKIRIFILSDDQILVQTEHQKDWAIQNLMGNIEFNLNLYDITDKSCIPVSDMILVNNGINSIIRVNETDILLKTGFPFLEDDRISGLSEDEALIESIYFGTMAMFISALQNATIGSDLKLLNTVYFDKGIVDPGTGGDYIYYSTINYKESTKESCFYNYLTGEQLKVMSDVSDVSDMKDIYVIGNIPYIRNSYEDRTEFFNLMTSEPDCVFYNESFRKIIGNLFVFSSREHKSEHVRIYRYPDLDLVCEEKGIYSGGCKINDKYYIYLT